MFLFYDNIFGQNLYCSALPRLRQIPAPAHRNSIVSIVSHYMAPSTINDLEFIGTILNIFLSIYF